MNRTVKISTLLTITVFAVQLNIQGMELGIINTNKPSETQNLLTAKTPDANNQNNLTSSNFNTPEVIAISAQLEEKKKPEQEPKNLLQEDKDQATNQKILIAATLATTAYGISTAYLFKRFIDAQRRSNL